MPTPTLHHATVEFCVLYQHVGKIASYVLHTASYVHNTVATYAT